jgi:hypothetical protein
LSLWLSPAVQLASDKWGSCWTCSRIACVHDGELDNKEKIDLKDSTSFYCFRAWILGSIFWESHYILFFIYIHWIIIYIYITLQYNISTGNHCSPYTFHLNYNTNLQWFFLIFFLLFLYLFFFFFNFFFKIPFVFSTFLIFLFFFHLFFFCFFQNYFCWFYFLNIDLVKIFAL